MLKRDSDGIVRWDDSDVPEGYTGSWHAGNGVWKQRCRECPETFEFPPGATCTQRYAGIGPHEVSTHGLKVAGINLGILS